LEVLWGEGERREGGRARKWDRWLGLWIWRKVLLIVWSLNVWSAEKPRQNILGVRGGLYILVFTLDGIQSQKNESCDTEFV
jgi:hypothetical protein